MVRLNVLPFWELVCLVSTGYNGKNETSFDRQKERVRGWKIVGITDFHLTIPAMGRKNFHYICPTIEPRVMEGEKAEYKMQHKTDENKEWVLCTAKTTTCKLSRMRESRVMASADLTLLLSRANWCSFAGFVQQVWPGCNWCMGLDVMGCRIVTGKLATTCDGGKLGIAVIVSS